MILTQTDPSRQDGCCTQMNGCAHVLRAHCSNRGDLSASRPSPCFSVWRNASKAWCLAGAIPSRNFRIMLRKVLLKYYPHLPMGYSLHGGPSLELGHFSGHANACRPRVTRGVRAGEERDEIYSSHLWTTSFWGSVKGGMNPGPEFNSSSML